MKDIAVNNIILRPNSLQFVFFRIIMNNANIKVIITNCVTKWVIVIPIIMSKMRTQCFLVMFILGFLFLITSIAIRVSKVKRNSHPKISGEK